MTIRLTRRALLAGAAALAAIPAARADTVGAIKSKGKLVVGIQGDNPPWGFVTTSGAQDGFDADMGRLFAKSLGVEAEFVALAVANRIPALVTGRVDILFATMAMLPDRAKSVQYSKPYVANEIQLVAAGTTQVKTDADMGKLVIGVPRSSVQDTQVTNRAPAGTTIRRFDDDAATIQALLSGQVQAVGANAFYLQRLDQARPGVFEKKLTFTSLYNGACTRLGEKDINAAVNAFIDQIKGNGELAKIYQKWMGYPPPDFPDHVDGVPFVAS